MLESDYDCWKTETADVQVAEILKTMKNNVIQAKKLISYVPEFMSYKTECACSTSLKNALMTEKEAVPPSTRRMLSLFLDKYWG